MYNNILCITHEKKTGAVAGRLYVNHHNYYFLFIKGNKYVIMKNIYGCNQPSRVV